MISLNYVPIIGYWWFCNCFICSYIWCTKYCITTINITLHMRKNEENGKVPSFELLYTARPKIAVLLANNKLSKKINSYFRTHGICKMVRFCIWCHKLKITEKGLKVICSKFQPSWTNIGINAIFWNLMVHFMWDGGSI